jgi:hypothetical protein
MNDASKDLLQNLSPIEPPAALKSAIVSRVGRLERRALLARRAVAIGADLLSAAAFVSALVTLVRSFQQSSFGSYLSLLLSDGRLVLSFWSQYLYSLSESLPVTGIAALLASFLLLLASLRYTSKFFDGRRGFARLI